jgi:hypothetical protein
MMIAARMAVLRVPRRLRPGRDPGRASPLSSFAILSGRNLRIEICLVWSCPGRFLADGHALRRPVIDDDFQNFATHLTEQAGIVADLIRLLRMAMSMVT